MPSATMHGGAEAALLHLLQERSSADFDLEVCFLENGQMVQISKALGVRTFVLDAKRLRNPVMFVICLRNLRRIILGEMPDVVLAWMTKAHIYSGLASAGTHSLTTYFQHGCPDDGIVDRLSRIIPAAGALTCSQFVAGEQRARVKHAVIPVPMAADVSGRAVDKSTYEMKKRFGFDPSLPLVGIVGRLQQWKGIHIYLRAMSKLIKRRPDLQGVVVGGKHALEPGYSDILQNILCEECIEDNIKLVGKQSNVPEWMQAMDVVVHASEREPFGIVIIEAMALQKPVVATKPGGPEEIITHGQDGLLVSHGDVQALSEAIESLLDNPNLSSKLATNAKERSTQFTTAHFAQNVSVALRSLLASSSCLYISEVNEEPAQ